MVTDSDKPIELVTTGTLHEVVPSTAGSFTVNGDTPGPWSGMTLLRQAESWALGAKRTGETGVYVEFFPEWAEEAP